MQFDDHEIWGSPVLPPAAPAPETPPAPEPQRSGRLYKSAGCEEPVEAIVALPRHQRRHTSVSAAEPTVRAAEPPSAAPDSGPRPPITISSLIPRPAPIEDPAIAEVLAPPMTAAPATAVSLTPAPSVSAPSAPASSATAEPVRAHAWSQTPSEHSGFTSWFRRSAPSMPAPVIPTVARSEKNVEARVASVRVASARFTTLDSATYAIAVFLATTIVGVVNAKATGALGTFTGLVFLVVSSAAAWRLDTSARWTGWAMPSYLLIASILVAGQFVDGAPGVSITGQIVLVLASLITLAPWLAATAAIGAALPALRRRVG